LQLLLLVSLLELLLLIRLLPQLVVALQLLLLDVSGALIRTSNLTLRAPGLLEVVAWGATIPRSAARGR